MNRKSFPNWQIFRIFDALSALDGLSDVKQVGTGERTQGVVVTKPYRFNEKSDVRQSIQQNIANFEAAKVVLEKTRSSIVKRYKPEAIGETGEIPIELVRGMKGFDEREEALEAFSEATTEVEIQWIKREDLRVEVNCIPSTVLSRLIPFFNEPKKEAESEAPTEE